MDESAPPELLEWLQSQHGEGQVDSSGVFTVDLLRARDKLARFQLALPSFFLLKFVQLGVRLGCQSILIRTGEPLCLTLLQPALEVPGLDQVQAHLTQTLPNSDDSPLGYLCSGLLAGLASEPDLLQWSAWWGQNGEMLQITAEGMARHYLDRARGFMQWGHRRLDLIVRGATRRDRVQEQASITARCGYSPVPVFLDRQPVSGEFWGTELPNPTPDHRCAELYQMQPPGPGLGVPGPRRRGARLLLDMGTPQARESDGDLTRLLVLCLQGAAPLDARTVRTDFCVALFRAPKAPLTAPGTVIWVKDGVACQACPEDLGIPGALAVVDAPALTVDISQFQLVRNQDYEHKLRELRQQILRFAEMVLRNLDGIPNLNPQGQALAGFGKGSCLGCLLGLLSPALLPLTYLVSAGAFTLWDAGSPIRRDQNQIRDLKTHLEACLGRGPR